MGTLARRLALAAFLGSTAACGDPVVILGDWPGIMRVVAGVPNVPGTEVAERATETQLIRPAALAIGQDGVLYVVSRRRVLAVPSDGSVSVVLDQEACPGEPCLARPVAAALDGAGGLVIADQSAQRVFRVDLSSGRLDVLAGNGKEGTSPDGTPAAEAPLATPTGVAVAPDGTVYFSELNGARVRTVSRDGTLGTLAGTGERGFGGDGGPATQARLSLPAGLALAGGTLYIGDTGNARIRAVDLAGGTIRTVAGTGSYGFGGDGGPALAAQFKNPRAVAVSPDERTLFIADTDNHRVRAVNLAAGTITTFAGTGQPEFNGTGNEAGDTALDSPSAVAVSPHGLLFIADTGHHIVWRTPIRF